MFPNFNKLFGITINLLQSFETFSSRENIILFPNIRKTRHDLFAPIVILSKG